MNWRVFRYNYSWPDYVWLLDGWIARMAMAIPVVGYLILFNDTVTSNLKFENLAAEDALSFGLSSDARLKLIYIGLLFLGCANIVYRLFRPYVMKIGVDQFSYVETALEHFAFSHYSNMHHAIRNSGFDPYTVHGKYYDSEWEGFKTAALGPGSKSLKEAEANMAQANWVEAKNKYESLLRSILIETFFRNVITRREILTTAILLALAGYLLLAIPSVDLFVKVMRVIIKPIIS